MRIRSRDEVNNTRDNYKHFIKSLGFSTGKLIGVTGESGLGKTTTVAHLLFSLKTCEKYLGFRVQNKPNNIAWLDADNMGTGLSDLFRSFSHQKNKDDFAYLDYFDNEAGPKFKESQLNLFLSDFHEIVMDLEDRLNSDPVHNKKTFDELTRLIDDTNAEILVVDTLIGFAGDIDENSSQIGVVVNELSQIAKNKNILIFLILHKSDKGNASYRGHSSIKSFLDEQIYIKDASAGNKLMSELIYEKSRVKGLRGATIKINYSEYSLPTFNVPKDELPLYEVLSSGTLGSQILPISISNRKKHIVFTENGEIGTKTEKIDSLEGNIKTALKTDINMSGRKVLEFMRKNLGWKGDTGLVTKELILKIKREIEEEDNK